VTDEMGGGNVINNTKKKAFCSRSIKKRLPRDEDDFSGRLVNDVL